jgi:ribonuclease G
MSENILINITPQETRVALIFQGAVQELHIERTMSRGLVGNIYLGKVVRVLPGMQSAFIDIGLERAAFLHVADIWDPRQLTATENFTPTPIEKTLFDGQVIMVQVIKDPIGTKGARLSTQISIAGRMLVHLPQDTHIGISQRIENEEDREALRLKVQNLLAPDEKAGFIVRTIAEDASEQELQMDMDYLRKTWANISQLAKKLPPTSFLHQDLNLAQRVLRDFINVETDNIQIDSRENFQKLLEFAASYTPAVIPKLIHYTGERPLFDLYSVEEEIERALGRRVELKSGGYLIIEQTEAMTTIDVNTGSFVAGRNFADTIFKTNLEATQAIARQI